MEAAAVAAAAAGAAGAAALVAGAALVVAAPAVVAALADGVAAAAGLEDAAAVAAVAVTEAHPLASSLCADPRSLVAAFLSQAPALVFMFPPFPRPLLSLQLLRCCPFAPLCCGTQTGRSARPRLRGRLPRAICLCPSLHQLTISYCF